MGLNLAKYEVTYFWTGMPSALYQEGAITPIFEGDTPPKKMTPNSGANIGAIAGELLKDP